MDYSTYFVTDQRKTGNRQTVKVVDSAKLYDFIAAVSIDESMSVEERALGGMLASSGLRISELLSVRRCDLEVTNDIMFKVKVLKKDRAYTVKRNKALADGKAPPTKPSPVIRKCLVLDEAKSVVLELLKSRRGFDKLFKLNRNQALNRMKKYFGDDMFNHAFRHSFISWRLYSGDQGAEICATASIVSSTLNDYTHITDINSKLRSYQRKAV